ncbi:MAG TPA: hypothetical protein VNM67_26735 [Thermoanaerobaculia bacterium]|jgi:hypothetical protein|nr:hypothetical protein [Thermoanaerobaculia bacterium]
MKKLIPFVTFAGAALLAALPASADEVVRTLERQVSAADASQIHLDFPVGELKVEAGSGREVEIQVDLVCDSPRKTRCIEAAKKIELAVSSGKNLTVELKGWPKSGDRGMEGKFHVTVPRDLPLNAELGVGDVTISGMEANLTANLGVGDIMVIMSESVVDEVHVDTGVGDAHLLAGGQSFEGSGFVGKELDWTKGSGKAEVEIDCGVGEARVRLE